MTLTQGPNPLNYPAIYHTLIEEQNHIGWLNFLRGRLSFQWHHQQGRYSSQFSDAEHIDSRGWATSLIKTIWHEWFLMWEDQNQDWHGRDETTRAEADKSQAQREISQLYEWRHFISSDNAHIFTVPLYTMLTKQTHQIIHWRNQWKDIILDDVHKQS